MKNKLFISCNEIWCHSFSVLPLYFLTYKYNLIKRKRWLHIWNTNKKKSLMCQHAVNSMDRMQREAKSITSYKKKQQQKLPYIQFINVLMFAATAAHCCYCICVLCTLIFYISFCFISHLEFIMVTFQTK